MSGALPVVSGKETVQALQRAGFVVVSTRGSHQKLRHDNGRVVIVPLHRELARGTLASIQVAPERSSTPGWVVAWTL
jgi:predicted RNA binding protein YcfA (HicA-like mRNA interferase family)